MEEGRMKELMKVPMTALGLSRRISNALRRGYSDTNGKVLDVDEISVGGLLKEDKCGYLRKWRGIGKKTYGIVIEKITDFLTGLAASEMAAKRMSEAEYNAAEGLRRSDLWKMADSPEKFAWFASHPMDRTPAMLFGSACHKMILEPDTFGDEYAVAPKVDRRTKEGKAEWDAFCEQSAGKEIVSPDDALVMAEMEAALEKCHLTNDLIRGEGQNEVPLFWTDPETGEKCKAKCDRIIRGLDGKFVIIDYKTTVSADTDKFCHEIFRYGYHFQAGFYSEGLKQALGLNYQPAFIFVAQEKKAPYSVNVIQTTEDVMRVGIEKYHELLRKYHECKELDLWEGYVKDDTPNETVLPGWYMMEDEE